MDIQQFLENYLPNYEEKSKNAFHRTMESKTLSRHEKMIWNEKHFAEALENYHNLICEKQRENCANAYLEYNGDDCDMETVSSVIDRAKQPKFNQ